MADNNSKSRQAGLSVNSVLAPVRRQIGNAADAYMTALSLGLNHQENRVAVRDFIGGVLGNDANQTAAALTAPRSAANLTKLGPSATVVLPPAKQVAPTAKSLTPAERQAAFVDSLFRHPLTLQEATAATGIMQRPDKVPSVTDIASQSLAAQSAEIYKEAVAKAAAVPDKAKAQDALEQARLEHFNRVATAFGRNPLNNAQAQQLLPQVGTE